MDEDLDELLGSDLLTVPEDFADRVMQRVGQSPLPTRRSQAKTRLQWLALIGGTIVGIAQLAAFVFGVWAAVAAG
jgi:hypothetical protein